VLVLLSALAVVTLPLPGGAEVRQLPTSLRQLPTKCGKATRAHESTHGHVPVLFVHGFLGTASNWRRSLHGNPSMLATVAEIPGAAVYTFDYHKDASKWVTDQAIGPALAKSIRCLGRAAGQKVVVVAHSMGGLATRVAQGQVIDGHAVSDALARVVTIGTPTRGVILLAFTNDRISKFVVEHFVDALGKACDKPPPRKHKRLCELLDDANAPATKAMAPDSPQLGALPAWAPGVVVHPIAADMRLRVSVFGLGTTVSIGDIVATVASATADASPGQTPRVVHCKIELTDLVNVIDRSPCAHTNEIANRRVIAAVAKQVRIAIREEEQKNPGV